jgi:hypothetical protein
MMQSNKKLTLIFIIALGAAYTLTLPNLGLADQKEDIFKAIQRDEYLRPHYTYESSISDFAKEKQCVCINYHSQDGRQQRSDRAFKWTIDVPTPTDGDISASRIPDVEKLDALVAVGLLSKEKVPIKLDPQPQFIDRYRLTEKGWAESVGRYTGKTCFFLGRAKHLSVISVSEIEVPIGRGEKESAYRVTVKVGFPRDYKLPDWANNSGVRRVFPLIDKLIAGYEREILMKKYSGQWREYLSPSQLARMNKSRRGRSNNYFSKNEPITKRETMLEAFAIQEHDNTYWSCISLPGDSSNGVRVDKRLGSGINYAVVIYNNKERAKWDDIETVTKPYLERLVSAGLLTSNEQTGIEGERKDAGMLFNGTIYRLAPEYKHIVDQKRGCIFMGKGKVKIIALEILAINTRDNPFERESFRYKYIMTYPNPPEWAKDKVLQAWWSDLAGALKYGLACEGQFVIDLTARRKRGTGGGSCWWAYDSVGEL